MRNVTEGTAWKMRKDITTPAKGAVPIQALVLAAPMDRMATINKAMLSP